MRRLSLIAIVLVFGLLGTGAVFLLMWDIPPPALSVEKTLPDDRFPR
jgi:hypothetical protein